MRKKVLGCKFQVTGYRDYTGDTLHRNHPGARSAPATVYTNATGRNDFHFLKVARDHKNLYFYTETEAPITKPEGDNWMRLYINMDRNAATGWNGYDYRVVMGKILQQYRSGDWKTINSARVRYMVLGNGMMITVPLLVLNCTADALQFEFKWSDNMQDEDPLDWYIKVRRFLNCFTCNL